jgi:hypothetical protein
MGVRFRRVCGRAAGDGGAIHMFGKTAGTAVEGRVSASYFLRAQ